MRNPDWRCILEIARTEFCPRRAMRGSDRAGGRSERLRREHSKLPKNLKTNRLEPYFVRAKEIFMNLNILIRVIESQIIFLLPVAILSFIVAYFTKETFDLQINTAWKARFKFASVVAKTTSALVVIYSLYLLSAGGFGTFAFGISIIPFSFLLIFVWGAAFLTSWIPSKNKYLLVLINLLIFAVSFSAAYSLTLPTVNRLNTLWREKQVSSIQQTASENIQPSVKDTLVEITGKSSIVDWKKIKIGEVSLLVPPKWSISSQSTLNHKLVQYIGYLEYFTSNSKIRFVMKDYVGADKVVRADSDINTQIISFVSTEYKVDPKNLSWGYLQSGEKKVGVKIINLAKYGGEEIPILFAFYRDGNLYAFSVRRMEGVAQEEVDELIRSILPIILGTIEPAL